MSLGDRIKEIRQVRDMSQRELADAVEMSNATISRLESGETQQLKSGAIRKLCDVLGVSADYLIGRTDDPSPHRSRRGSNVGSARSPYGTHVIDEPHSTSGTGEDGDPGIRALIAVVEAMSRESRVTLKEHADFLVIRDIGPDEFFEEVRAWAENLPKGYRQSLIDNLGVPDSWRQNGGGP